MTPKEINDKKFDSSFLGGYKKSEVDSFLNSVAKEYQSMLEENNELKEKISELLNKVNEYQEQEGSLRAALINAQKLGDKVIRESKEKAELIVRDAQVKAENIIDNTKKQLEFERNTYKKIRDEVGTFKDKIYNLYKEHIASLNTIPEKDENLEPLEEQKIEVIMDEAQISENNEGEIKITENNINDNKEDNE